jgi:hypothetical protein
MKSKTRFFVTCLLTLWLTSGPAFAQWKSGGMRTELRSIYTLNNLNRRESELDEKFGMPLISSWIVAKDGIRWNLASAQNPGVHLARGSFAQAEWWNGGGESDCESDFLIVNAFDGLQTNNGATPLEHRQQIRVLFQEYNFCTNEGFFVEGFLLASSADELHIDPSLTSASVHATIPLDSCDVGTCPSSIDLNLSWSGSGQFYKDIDPFSHLCPGNLLVSVQDTFRPASVTGDVSSAGVNLLTDFPNVFAELGTAEDTTIDIGVAPFKGCFPIGQRH